MSRRGLEDVVRWALVAAILVLGLGALLQLLPWWAGAIAMALLFGGALLLPPWRRGRHESKALPPPTAEQEAERQARLAAGEQAWRAEVAEHERVEGVLRRLLEERGISAEVRGPLGGHMDKRETDYRLRSPLRLEAMDIAKLSGPVTKLETREEDEATLLVRLSARDRHGGGVEVWT